MIEAGARLPRWAAVAWLPVMGLVLSLSLCGCNPGSSQLSGEVYPTMPPTRSAQEADLADIAPSAAPSRSVRFEQLGLEQGLSQNSVHALVQDRMGFLWIGTEDGLNRYDGYDFEVFRPDPTGAEGLGDRWITALYEDSSGRLWIGTRLGGLALFDNQRGTFQRYQHDPADNNSLGSDSITALDGDGSGGIWVGTSNGLDLLDPKAGMFRHYGSDPSDPNTLSSNRITAVHVGQQGILWIGTSDLGLNRLDPVNRKVTRYPYSVPGRAGPCHNRITSVEEDLDGGLWIGTSGGLSYLDPLTGVFTCYRHQIGRQGSLANDAVYAIYQDRAGELWIGTNDGLDLLDREDAVFRHFRRHPGVPDTLSSNTVFSIYEDRGGVLWVGTYGGGLNKHNPRRDQFAYYRHDPDDPASLSMNQISPLLVDRQGYVWIGTYAGGLNRLDPKTGLVTRFRHDDYAVNSLSSDQVLALMQDHEGVLWVGTSLGLERLYANSGKFSHYIPSPTDPTLSRGSAVNLVFEDSSEGLWAGTDSGLRRFDRETGLFYRWRGDPEEGSFLGGKKITAIHEAPDRTLWLGTFDSGLVRYDRGHEILTRYRYDPSKPGSLSNDSVMAIHEDSQGRLWIATAGGGLNLYHPDTDTFSAVTEIQGLASNVVYGILEDSQGRLWLSTNYGLSRFDPELGPFRNYTVHDGLQSNEFSPGAFAQAPDGTMYFGGINGLTAFRPTEIKDNPYVPPIVLTSLTYEGQPLAPDRRPESLDSVILRWPQNSVEFEFAALGYAEPERNVYAYRLDPFDNGWSYIGTRRNGGYTNLPGGIYTLRLKGTNNDGVWNESGATLHVTVVPPFWGMLWFRVGAAVLLLGASYVGYRARVRAVESRNRELARQVSERTADLERRHREMEALYHADEKMLRYLTLEQVLRTLVDVAVDMLPAEKAAVFLWNEALGKLELCVARGFGLQAEQHLAEVRDEGFLADLASRGELMVMSAAPEDSKQEADQPEIVRAVCSEGPCSFLFLPIKSSGDVLGIFCAGFTRPVAFYADTARLFTALVQRAALSIENTRLFDRTKELAILEERNRLARDLHDSAKQKAFAALAQLGTASGILGTEAGPARSHLNEAENLVTEVIQELTFLIQEMYPQALKDKGLATTLREYVFEWENRNEMEAALVIEGERRLPLQAEQAVYRIVQEALANVARHSRATRVEVSLAFGQEMLHIEVKDNGCGFNPGWKPPGMGLRSIRERVESVGGSLEIDSAPGQGTCVLVQVPAQGSWDSTSGGGEHGPDFHHHR